MRCQRKIHHVGDMKINLPVFADIYHVIFLNNLCISLFPGWILWYKNTREKIIYARMAELADALDSGSSEHNACAGSNPVSRTKKLTTIWWLVFW